MECVSTAGAISTTAGCAPIRPRSAASTASRATKRRFPPDRAPPSDTVAAAMAAYEERKQQLIESLSAAAGGVSLGKKTSSNLFRYQPRSRAGRRIDLSGFNRVLRVDAAARTLEVEGLATFEAIVDHTLPHGLVPLITPELKHITIGGAIVGIGIESNCFRHEIGRASGRERGK